MDEALPYRILNSIGGENCKKCRHEIMAGDIQIAIMVQVNFIFFFFENHQFCENV